MKTKISIYLLIIGLSMFNLLAQDKSVTLKKGQLISFITSQPKPNKDAERNEYFQKVFPPAQALGYKLEGSFDIKNVKANNYNPYPVMNLFSWPNQESFNEFQNNTPGWKKIKATRPNIWEELRINRLPVKEDKILIFKKDKIYRVVFIWENKSNPKDLDKYLKGMKKTREKLGARYLIEVKGEGTYHSLVDKTDAPDRFWIIEWPNSEAHELYLKSEAFQKNQKYFSSGVARFNSYEGTFR